MDNKLGYMDVLGAKGTMSKTRDFATPPAVCLAVLQVPEGLPGYLYHLYSYLYNATSNVKTSIPDGSQEVSWGREANDEGSSVETVLSQSPLVSILY